MIAGCLIIAAIEFRRLHNELTAYTDTVEKRRIIGVSRKVNPLIILNSPQEKEKSLGIINFLSPVEVEIEGKIKPRKIMTLYFNLEDIQPSIIRNGLPKKHRVLEK